MIPNFIILKMADQIHTKSLGVLPQVLIIIVGK